MIVKGRPQHLFTQAIAKGKARLEEMTTVGKVRYGDYPDRNSKYLSAITLVSGITDFSRLDQMKRRVQELGEQQDAPQNTYGNGVAEPTAV